MVMTSPNYMTHQPIAGKLLVADGDYWQVDFSETLQQAAVSEYNVPWVRWVNGNRCLFKESQKEAKVTEKAAE
jgi:hypothetical protein